MSSWIGEPDLSPLERPDFIVQYCGVREDWNSYFSGVGGFAYGKQFAEKEAQFLPLLNRRIIHRETGKIVCFIKGTHSAGIASPRGWRKRAAQEAKCNFDKLKEEDERFRLLRDYPDWYKEAKYMPETVVWNTRIKEYVFLEGTEVQFINEEPNVYYHWERDGEHCIDHEDTLQKREPVTESTKTGLIRRTLNFILG